jgi:arsenate reductase
MLPKLKILFLCTGNSRRSQMAEAWARALHGERLEARSAGTAPGRLDPRAVQVMAEVGIDLSGHHSKHLDEFAEQDFDWVVIVCDRANESCPIFPGSVRLLHASFDDPPRPAANATSEDEAPGHYRRVRDEIRAFVETLPGELGGHGAESGA